jgi:hypothetical protein
VTILYYYPNTGLEEPIKTMNLTGKPGSLPRSGTERLPNACLIAYCYNNLLGQIPSSNGKMNTDFMATIWTYFPFNMRESCVFSGGSTRTCFRALQVH